MVSLTSMSTDQELELKKEIILEGTGPGIERGSTAVMHYTGTLEDGTKFDSSRDRAKTFEFPLGAEMVIRGWELGILGMKVGEKAKLTIPYTMAYGEAGIPGVIPPKATLIFDVELVAIK
jgi:FKBP-type peptidyl-prolyl cis-trans isomerase